MSDTIAAVATGNSAGGIGVIRISGEDAIKIADRVFSAADCTLLSELYGYTARYGHVSYNGESYDDAVALVFRAPKSYTGEDVVELSVHGGIFIIEKTLEAVLSAGAVPAQAGEFTKRAFLNGKMDLTKAESVAELISAQGEIAAKAAYCALSGTLYNKVNTVLGMLIECSALMSAWVDYPDEDIPELKEDSLAQTLEAAADTLEEMLNNYESGQIMTGGIDTAIVGRPNVGKSSLMNLITGKEKSIVTDVRGTTRDIVEETVRLGDLVLHLADTAGLRESTDIVETIGIERAYEKIENAQLVLPVFDSSEPLTKEDEDLIARCEEKNAVAIINKQDLDTALDTKAIENGFDETVYISAKSGQGLEALTQAVKRMMGVSQFDPSAPILANKRQKQCCKNAYQFLQQAKTSLKDGMTYDAVNVMIDSAADELLCLTGKRVSSEVVDHIFSKFCVGK